MHSAVAELGGSEGAGGLTGRGREPMSGCTAAARCCVLRLGFAVSSASSPRTLASCRAFSSLRITSVFCVHKESPRQSHRICKQECSSFCCRTRTGGIMVRQRWF